MHIVEQAHPYWKGMKGFSKVLFPTDFSKSANHALENALCLKGVHDVIVQHVVSTYFEKHPHWSTLFDIHEAQKFMDMYIETEMAKVPGRAQAGISCRTVISEGKPAQQIVQLADKEAVDLIIMGPAKGVTTHHGIRASRRHVLAIPQSGNELRPRQQRPKRLVTTDVSPYSKAVDDYAFQLKQLIDFELFLLHVIELSTGIKIGIRKGYFTDASSKLRNWSKNQLENLTPRQFADDASVHRLIEEGPVSDKIAETAEAYDADLIILGTHGYGAVEKHFVGTTTSKVLARVSRPILTVKM